MVIRKERPAKQAPRYQEGRRPSIPHLAPLAVHHWWYQALEEPPRPMSVEDRRYRASWANSGCERQLWYLITGEEPSNPPGLASRYRMMTGQMGHDFLDEHMGAALREYGWTVIPELAVDLEPIGIPGAASADFLLIDPDGRHTVVEAKTQGGFSYKLSAAGSGKMVRDPSGIVPQGPKFEHVVQGGMAAEAISVEYGQAVDLVILYLSMEVMSVDFANRFGIDEIGRFASEWMFTPDEYAPYVEHERQRVSRVIAEPFVPAPVLNPDDRTPAGAVVVDPNEGWWVKTDEDGMMVDRWKTWRCGYCDFKDRCLTDGV